MGEGSIERPAPAREPSHRLHRVLRSVERAVAVLSMTTAAAAALLLAAIFLIICYSVGMRYFAGLPQPWADEVVGWLLAGSVMLAAPEVQRRGGHIGIDLLPNKAGARLRRGLMLFGLVTVLVAALVFVREGIVMVEFSRMLNILSNQLPNVPMWMVQIVVPVGFSMLALVALVQLACLMSGLAPREMSEAQQSDVA